jgi:chromate transport protein ChrA
MAEAGSRIRKNLAHFRLNYALVVAAILALTLLTHPFSLLLLAALFAAWIFAYLLRTTPLTLFNRAYSEREVLIVLSLLSVVVLFMTSVGSVLISAAMLGLLIICVHGALHVPDDLFLDAEIPSSSSSLLPFLSTGTLPSSVVSAAV